MNEQGDIGLEIRVVRLDPRGRWVVIDKPAGVLSVPGKSPEKQDCAAARVRAAFPDARGPLVVHRLDMDTSGLLVLGLDEGAQRDLSAQFEARRTRKAYIALVEGVPAAESGIVRLPLRADIDNRPVQVIDLVNGREAVTRWRVLAIEHGRARVRLEPETGRTHQLRVHMAHLGCPIVGDVLYGEGGSGERLMLHASELGFADPTDGLPVAAVSPPPF